MLVCCEDAVMSQPPGDLPTFEQALSELERLVRELEDGQIGLEESLARYERGIGLLKHCYGQLQLAEQRILQLSGVDQEERPLAKPFQHASADTAKTESSNRKRTNNAEKLF
jgi:exodeoxyribonuclease VII small subunit